MLQNRGRLIVVGAAAVALGVVPLARAQIRRRAGRSGRADECG